MITITEIDEMIEAKFAYEEARERLYFGDVRPIDRVYEPLNFERFEKVRRVLGKTNVHPVRIGNIVNRSFEYGGCVFLCTQVGEEQ